MVGRKLNFQKIDTLLDEVMRMLNRMVTNLQTNSCSLPPTHYSLKGDFFAGFDNATFFFYAGGGLLFVRVFY